MRHPQDDLLIVEALVEYAASALASRSNSTLISSCHLFHNTQKREHYSKKI